MTTSPTRGRRKGVTAVMSLLIASGVLAGCSSWEGPNSLPLPGAQGSTGKSYQIHIELPNVLGIQKNSRVLVNDVNVGTISGVQVHNWSALVTAKINSTTSIPANAIARIGQTSLLGTLHLEFDIPAGQQPQGRLADGATVALDRAGAYPSTEETLAAVSVVLNGGGFAELAEVQQQVGLALQGSETDNRQMIENLAKYTTSIAKQTDTIVEAVDQINRFAGVVADQRPVLDRALKEIPAAIAVLNQRQKAIVDAANAIGGLADNTNQIVTRSRSDISANLENLAPSLRALASNGRDLTRGLNLLSTYPWPENGVQKFIRGDYANLSATIDLTLSRLDQSFLTGTPYAGSLTALETALGRKSGVSPTNNNPLAAPTNGGR